MQSECKLRSGNRKRKSRNEEKAKAIIVEAVTRGILQMNRVRELKDVVVETLEVDHWGKRNVYNAKGHVNVMIRASLFHTKQGEKGFNAMLDAKNMEMLLVDWKPGTIAS